MSKHDKQKLLMGEVVPAGKLDAPRSFILHGLYKRGKSTLAASISEVPGFSNVLLIDIDRGAGAFARKYPGVGVLGVRRGDYQAFQRVWDLIVKNDGTYLGVAYDAIIIDTISILQQWKIKATNTGANTYAKWDEVKSWTLETLWQLHDMTPVGIATFHTEVSNIMRGADPEDGFSMLTPSLSGSAKVNIGAVVDVIGYCYVEEGKKGNPEYRVRFDPSENVNAGNRFPLPSVLGNPTMKRIYELIEGKDNKNNG